MRKSSKVVLSLIGLTFLTGCELFRPTPVPPPTPTNIYIVNSNNNNIGQTNPNGGTTKPSVTPTHAKVTIIGGNGTKQVKENTNFTTTFTRFVFDETLKKDVEVPGEPSDDITWEITGNITNRELDNPDSQNYNLDLRSTSVGNFTAEACQLSLNLCASITGTVVK